MRAGGSQRMCCRREQFVDAAQIDGAAFPKALINIKNSDGLIPGSSASQTFSPPRRVREKRVTSKALLEWAGYRPRCLRPIFPLSSAVFSAGWELRQFSTQLGFSAKSRD